MNRLASHKSSKVYFIYFQFARAPTYGGQKAEFYECSVEKINAEMPKTSLLLLPLFAIRQWPHLKSKDSHEIYF